MSLSVIYCIENIINNHVYIGSAVDYKDRKRLHIQHLNKNKHHSKYLQKAWNLYGEKNFKFYILEEVEESIKLIEREQFWIDNKTSDYNMCKKAGSSLGLKRSEETKEKCRLAHLGEKHSEERRKIKSISQKGKKKNYSIETRNKFILNMKKIAKITALTKRKPIYQFDLNMNFLRKWSFSGEIEQTLGFKKAAIQACAKKGIGKSYGYIWRYELNEQVSHSK